MKDIVNDVMETIKANQALWKGAYEQGFSDGYKAGLEKAQKITDTVFKKEVDKDGKVT